MLYIPNDRIGQKKDIEDIYSKCLKSIKDDLFIAFLDANGLKSINDKYGHLTGDAVISSMQDSILDNIGPNDSAVRFGGDEFIIFFNESSKEDIQVIIHNMQEQFRMDSKLCNITTGCSVSVGLVKYDKIKKPSILDIIDAADKLMYQAKNNAPTYYMYSENLDKIVLLHKDGRSINPEANRLRMYFKYIAGIVLGENQDLTREEVVNTMRRIWSVYHKDLIYKYTTEDIVIEIVQECQSVKKAA